MGVVDTVPQYIVHNLVRSSTVLHVKVGSQDDGRALSAER